MPDSPPSVSPEQYASFTQSVRDLADATLRTNAGAAEIAAAQAQVEAITARLASDQIPGTHGEHCTGPMGVAGWGNTVVGLRNPAAMPLHFSYSDDGNRLWADFTPGALYEGPPGHMHGGVIAMLLDQALGEIAVRSGRPGLTANLSVNYKLPTKLNTPLRIEAWYDRTEGVKTWTAGHITSEHGVCAEAEGLFILPRWVRDLPPEEAAKLHQHD
ncbi:PaaI family thioesterase [Nocardioides jishulii]|uniref:Acyl-coenzyme A thioesterase THEM4 n=1 Tax=Nocardioides jishulii TaxID=2575440 RepID=A0A4U2YRP6_9ACTN|nr:PaaI family thioesterase [Nocardioides jishulii]QCX26415.1 PaaI family thioesterase [Nocardioides jishulii]TKI63780.1 PaaI family thioesterase [Nocardioides jishulii]